MTYISSNQSQLGQISAASKIRAARAVRCTPLLLKLFIDMRQTSVPLPQIAETAGVKSGYIAKSQSERRIESHLMWLIQVGLLRREVDGQGLTDSFRLTPLGRELVKTWEKQGFIPPASVWDHLQNALRRWLRLPELL